MLKVTSVLAIFVLSYLILGYSALFFFNIRYSTLFLWILILVICSGMLFSAFIMINLIRMCWFNFWFSIKFHKLQQKKAKRQMNETLFPYNYGFGLVGDNFFSMSAQEVFEWTKGMVEPLRKLGGISVYYIMWYPTIIVCIQTKI